MTETTSGSDNDKILTIREKQTLQVIRDYLRENGHAPTTSEIADGLGIKSKGTAHRYVKALEAANQIKLHPGQRRNISLIDMHVAGGGQIPLWGKIAAGCPLEAIPEQESIDLNVFTGPNRFALKICGESMIEEGIHDGDIVVCQSCQSAENGAIVVALVDNECATLKKLQRNSDGTITLIPANADFLPMVYEAHRVQIQGVFVGLLRFTSRL